MDEKKFKVLNICFRTLVFLQSHFLHFQDTDTTEGWNGEDTFRDGRSWDKTDPCRSPLCQSSWYGVFLFIYTRHAHFPRVLTCFHTAVFTQSHFLYFQDVDTTNELERLKVEVGRMSSHMEDLEIKMTLAGVHHVSYLAVKFFFSLVQGMHAFSEFNPI